MAQRNKKMGQPKDAIAMLKADHQRVRDLFQQYEATSNAEAKRTLAEEVFIELETHAQLEENIFYPAVNEETDEGPELVKESLAEHETMKNLIQQLRDMGPHNGGFDPKFRELLQNVDYHLAEEDTDLFPLVEEELEKDMQDLQHKMQELKAQILAS